MKHWTYEYCNRGQRQWQSSRRDWLRRSACGFGALAAASLANQSANVRAEEITAKLPVGAYQLPKGCHHLPKAKRIIFLFMQGGVSQVDSFDHKPLLQKRNGETFTFNDARQLAKIGQATQQRIMQSPWRFRPYGESGRLVSDLFPCTAQHVDELTMLHGMHTEGVAHGPATLFLHCGATNFVRPSFGSWVTYGLGSENDDLPGFVSIAPSIGNGGPRNYGQAFLPAQFQGTPVGNPDSKELLIKDLLRTDLSAEVQHSRIALLSRVNQLQVQRRFRQNSQLGSGGSSAHLHGSNNLRQDHSLGLDASQNEVEAVLDSYELGWRMQASSPALFDMTQETSEVQRLYGLDDPITEPFGRRCLLARRLCEAGVRFIQVNYGDNSANPAWDQHSNLPKHADHALAVDRPIAGLLTDLRRRGLLDDTIVWWGSEFGRTPYAQDNGTGRDHNPVGFTAWLAGGGFQPGLAFGQTDEFGFQAVQGKVHMHDLHATLLHQLGIDHRRLTHSHAGRDFRLTDVHGRLVKEIISERGV